MEFEKNLMCDIIANFMKMVDDYAVCYCDKYDRKRSSIFINWDYVNFINIRTFNFDSLFIPISIISLFVINFKKVLKPGSIEI